MALAPDNQRKVFGQGEVLQEPPPSPLSEISSCLEKLKVKWTEKGSLAALWHDWPKIAGEKLASNCRPISLRRGVLIIGASHPQWRQALIYNRSRLLASLKAGGHNIKDLRIQQHHLTERKTIENESSIWERHPSRIDIHGLASCDKCGSPAPAGEMALWGKCGFCRRQDLEEQREPPHKDSSF